MEVEDRLNQFLTKQPTLGRDVFVAAGAVLLGDVTVGEASSVWYNAVLRADINRIVIGHHTNVQDNSVLHLADEFPCILGNYVTVGHGAIVHACTVRDGTLVGMGATILDGSDIGEECLIGAGSLVTQGSKVPAGMLVLGSPASAVRPLSAKERQWVRSVAEKYVRVAAYFRKHGGTPFAPTIPAAPVPELSGATH